MRILAKNAKVVPVKAGHPLKDIPGFGPEALRSELSVTTAEEFLYFSSQYKNELTRLLDAEPRTVDQFADAAASVVDEDEMDALLSEPGDDMYAYRTGHMMPQAILAAPSGERAKHVRSSQSKSQGPVDLLEVGGGGRPKGRSPGV